MVQVVSEEEVLVEVEEDSKMGINIHLIGFMNGIVLMLILRNFLSGLRLWITFISLLCIIIFLEERLIFSKLEKKELKGGKTK